MQAPKGTKDILPSEVYKWHYIENRIEEICKLFGYKEIRTPVFEYTELFNRSVGDTTDIVQKEMYTFEDKAGRSVTLRPEGTAGVVRSYIENGMSSLPQPLKLYYNISAYRYENVQKGRLREFHQFGVELIGSPNPSADVEVISMLSLLFSKLGLRNISLNINNIGCSVCRKEYNKKIHDHLAPIISGFCATCNERFIRNPFRILDCKEEKCKRHIEKIPPFLESLCEHCRKHFEEVTGKLDTLEINYRIDKNIVRGLDYYTGTVFEFVSEDIGSQGTICGGGRYDGLIGTFGSAPAPAVGFAIGLERLLMVMENQGIEIPKPAGIDVFIASIGEKADMKAEKLLYELRAKGISCERNLMDKSLKAQFKYANRIQAANVIVLGENEIQNNTVILKDMQTGGQQEIDLDEIINRFPEKLRE